MLNRDLADILPAYRLEYASKEIYPDIFRVEQTNPDYFLLEQEEPITLESCIAGLNPLPPGTSSSQKHCLCLYRDTVPIAILDYVEGYPDPQTVYIGFFMLNGNFHRQGFGREIISSFQQAARKNRFERIELGVIAENEKGLAFWTSMGFREIRRVERKRENGNKQHLISMELSFIHQD